MTRRDFLPPPAPESKKTTTAIRFSLPAWLEPVSYPPNIPKSADERLRRRSISFVYDPS
jgi:hypothetical protein